MNVLFLTNNLDVTKPLYEWLCEVEGTENVRLWGAPLAPGLFNSELCGVDFLISYNYLHIIKKSVLDIFNDRCVNLHISLLPWNRGASPNLWSFLEDTPKGVTIHLIDEGIDTGSILFQRQMFFEENSETFATSYNKLHTAIQELFRDNWHNIKNGKVSAKKQGSFHTQKETDKIVRDYAIDWTDNIAATKKKITFTPPRIAGV